MATASASAAVPSTTITGKVLHKESSQGLADLQIDLFDLEAWADPEGADAAIVSRTGETPPDAIAALERGDLSSLYKLADRIGSVATDANGRFTLDVLPRDFNLPRKNEQKPDLILLVLAPDEPGLDLDKRLLHFARDIRFNAGSKEAYIIRLPTALLQERQIPVGTEADASRETPANKVSVYIANQDQEKAFNAGAANYHGTQATLDAVERKAFRTDFMKTIGADLMAAPPSGVVATEGDNIKEKNAVTVLTGIGRANAMLGAADAQGVPVNLYLTPADRTRLHTYFDNASGDFVDIPDAEMQNILFRANSSDNPGTLLIHNNPIANFCATNSADVACAQLHAGLSSDQAPFPTPPAPATSDEAIVDADIPTYIGRLVTNMPTPDVVLQPGLGEKRADRAKVEKAINDFVLGKGPAEVPAFYDFTVLQIAFDHVWKQLFDEAIPNLAYTANTLGKSRFGIDSVLANGLRNGLLSLGIGYVVAPVDVPPVVAKHFDVTRDEFNEMSYSLRDELIRIANSVNARSGSTIADLRVVQALTEQGERLIDSVRHDDNYTLHKTLRDLNERLSGKYDFTVFAADKDYHSVNFGLLYTYQEQLTPLTYQAGDLVKTIPLAPKEERKYSVRSVRNEKRSTREARKNNSAITSEQQSTSRVEAEIAAKAQTKTAFSLSAEGEYDIGISDGKSTTTFGVEALNESSQNRKDFREAMLKAVQEYKQETSIEVTSEVDTTAEYTESGTLVNPNDELAVTYLFYELQKRYRISEQIYRVMPVLLVAQEVPSPDQITPAWVIANDWIIKRHLLDDSFRPTLAYLASNSVGDDFSLRELRKNLRQQRNLVDTLRIEFSAASIEADNRYKALEAAISNRIDEEHKERTDGLGSDIWDFFGGGGQDPEAAKARELAAKDAHQYAKEKAERAAAALREEVGNLHTITEAYNKAMQARLDNETKVKRLLVHIRNNIFYYMQAIWSMEPPDQRFLRLYKVQVPILELASRSYRVKVTTDPDIFASFREPGTEKHRAFLHGTLKHNPDGAFDTRPLVEMADLETLLGFKGNYMIFPMKEHNALTEFMAAPYIDSSFGAMDPDELSNVNLDEYSKYVCCLHEKLPPADFEAIQPQLRAWLQELLATPLRNGDEIVVPTGSLFIEALVDQNPILEDFKLKHRELDVYKVLEESRKASLENLRLASRLLNAEREDPDIDKKIVIEGAGSVVVSPSDH